LRMPERLTGVKKEELAFCYAVNEIYPSIQGEGWHTGKPCTVLRLQGCNLRCPFCDTMYAVDSDGGRVLSLEEIDGWMLVSHPKDGIVLVTGGEPGCQPYLEELADSLRKWGPVHLETNGTQVIPNCFDWVTVSPKGPEVEPVVMKLANEVKWLVEDWGDVALLKHFLREYDEFQGTVSVQPLSAGVEATRICVRAAIEKGWRLSVQVHKLIGVA